MDLPIRNKSVNLSLEYSIIFNISSIIKGILLGVVIYFHQIVELFHTRLNRRFMKSKAIFYKLYEENPEQKKVDKIVEILKKSRMVWIFFFTSR